MTLLLRGQPEPTPHPYNPRACWQCHGEGWMHALVIECDDGEQTWDEVQCWRCGGNGKEPAKEYVERGEVPPEEM